MMRFLRKAAVIARRDFLATVFTPAFLMFLLAPLFMLAFATVGGTGARMIADSGDESRTIVVIADAPLAAQLDAEDSRMRALFPEPVAPPPIEIRTPGRDPGAQARALIENESIEIVAVLFGGVDDPHILFAPDGERSANYLGALFENTVEAERAASFGGAIAVPERETIQRSAATISGRQATGFTALFVLFLLTLLLAGQTVSVLAEEKGNKVIEILAAAVPLETVFFGKLFGLFGVALLFVSFWGGIIAFGLSLMPDTGAALAALDPAIGFGPFLALAIVYFGMGYLLLGAVFLAVGAQATSMREIQMLSLPITFFQMAMFGFASAAAAAPGSALATAAELFPFSSPFAMAARGATDPALWPHAAAIAWQILWVSITIAIGARLFRKGVLKSGPSFFRSIGKYLRCGRGSKSA
ncbi:MAG: ABC transporter permease [Sphingomonadaceae bacterium]|nr:ABC transporter permease [Sphingomonadaceae bacterium]